ncbi:1f81454b-8b86-4cc3-8501-d4e412b49600 [Thermothielavioides terrestris]|uniref:1f81454b-8b86-4cc3-8501-d4e412b49600 n=1 Tax=Thermothielavioides terrestris TaxID=2587410 RepID=A0A3S4ASK1_9PEZI|nr:1f81454b-8b86-4cc3-8501-d4e412b49600 [Thermothielavioides terrestris]
MAPTRTVKNKHAATKSSSSGSKGSKKKSAADGVSKSKGRSGSKAKAPATQVKGRPNLPGLDKKKKQRVYTDKELGIPELNMVTPVGVTKPRGKKKGKVFVDDRESMATILALVQAEKEGQIESKMMRARQLEEIREARRAEAEKKEAERKAKLEETKNSLRKKRKRNRGADGKGKAASDEEGESVKEVAATGTKAAKAKKKKRVSFAPE